MKIFNIKLSKSDANAALDIIDYSLSCNNNNDIVKIFNQIGSLLLFKHARCLYVNKAKVAKERMNAVKFITSYPEAWEERYDAQGYVFKDSVALYSMQHDGLFFWDDVRDKNESDSDKLVADEAASIGLIDGWSYNRQGRRISESAHISIGGDHIEHDKRSRILLDHIFPHVCEAVLRINKSHYVTHPRLTPRELEVLRWIAEGKTAWEISVILNISNRTVEFHTGNIISKFDAVNSQQAVAIALHHNIIDL